MPFRDIPGHRRILDLLARSIANDALPPSLLFGGPPGAPTRETAVAVAQALNCQSPVVSHQASVRSRESSVDDSRLTTDDRRPTSDACGVCSVCVRIARGIHPDVQLLAPGDTGSIKIEQVRDVVERTAYRPFEGVRRVVIIDEADALVGAAQNALLKTLEEPPPSSVFILMTARPDALLPTVRSRLIRLSFAAGGPVDVDPDARTIAERVLAQAAAAADPARRLEAAQDLLAKTGAGGATDREQLASHLHAVALMLRDVEVVATGADPRLLAQPESRPAVERLMRTFRGERGINAFLAVDRALEALDGNAGVKVVADWVALQL
jgi:DNA polymerase-3 subunit delta'